MQVVHRISSPDALSWSERCRVLYRDFGDRLRRLRARHPRRPLLRVRSLTDRCGDRAARRAWSVRVRARCHTPSSSWTAWNDRVRGAGGGGWGRCCARRGRDHSAAVRGVARRSGASPSARPSVPMDLVVRDAVAGALAEMRASSPSRRARCGGAGPALRAGGRRSCRRTSSSARAAKQARDQSVAELGAKKDVIDTRLDEMRSRDAHRAHRAGRHGEGRWPSRARKSSARWTSRCAATPRSPRCSPSRRGRCARRSRHPRPAASGASAWPTTCCGWRASSRTSTTSSRPSSTAPPAGPTSRSRSPRATSSTWT